MSKPRIIAFYLPQYHPTPDNDKWWGKGFTEWTNVGKAKPLFRGHYQPKVPADLGYYDLRLPEVREAQAELAREAGIYGFCYYHYWFGNGKEELELPFNEVLRLGKPDFPFMLCWANESWHKKFWDKDGNGSSKELLIEQTYPGEQDIIDHFYRLLPAFKDPRYIRINGKPAFMIYRPEQIPNVADFIKRWHSLAQEEGLEGIYFISHTWNDLSITHIDSLFNVGFSAINTLAIWITIKNRRSFITKVLDKTIRPLFKHPIKKDFRHFLHHLFSDTDSKENIFPTIIPNWDHTARSGTNGTVLTFTSPEEFKKQIKLVLDKTSLKKDNYIFLKSWNEWGEGNYMEPDLKYGHGYINALKETLEDFNS